MTIEAEARSLRDLIYGPGTDNNWDACRDAWLRDIAWLRKRAEKIVNAKGGHPQGS